MASSSLIIDYRGGDEISSLGTAQLEGQELGDDIPLPGSDQIYIRPDKANGALHFHRDAHFRRAEVEAKGGDTVYTKNKVFYVGYAFSLSKQFDELVVFQWKKAVKTTQNIPFHVFIRSNRLVVAIQKPADGTSLDGDYEVIWTDTKDFQVGKTYRLALSWDTKTTDVLDDNGSTGQNTLALWVDGEKKIQKGGLVLWTGDTYPKFGIYRGEADPGAPSTQDSQHTFDSYIYRVQVSDESLKDVEDASGPLDMSETKSMAAPVDASVPA